MIITHEPAWHERKPELVTSLGDKYVDLMMKLMFKEKKFFQELDEFFGIG